MIVQSDVASALKLVQLRAWLSGGVPLLLHLYRNNFRPVTNTVTPGAFVEANFSGYVSVNLYNTFGLPVQEMTGVYYIQATHALFAHSGGPVDNDIFGWYLTRGTAIAYSEAFPVAVTMAAGTSDLDLFVRIYEQARSILTCF